jgi:hypothetical protein
MVNALPPTPSVGAFVNIQNSGSLNYIKSFGNVSLDDSTQPISSDTTFVLASATKIVCPELILLPRSADSEPAQVTCVAAMQCVERGLVNLDDDITDHLPEWKHAMILTGFDEKNDGKPILTEAVNPITLR